MSEEMEVLTRFAEGYCWDGADAVRLRKIVDGMDNLEDRKDRRA